MLLRCAVSFTNEGHSDDLFLFLVIWKSIWGVEKYAGKTEVRRRLLFENFLSCTGVQLTNSVVVLSGVSKGTQTYTCIHSPPNSPPIPAAT